MLQIPILWIKKIKFFKKYYKVLEKDSDIYSVRLKQSDNNSLEILYILITEARASSTCSKDATSNSRRNSLW